ncbi:MAG: GNAT family N-acetyltransferase [Crocinitomicaceae bacterium]|nr:GNAT family N-acetyltransferase [Crocinitomicaceae bacterium]
MHPLNHRYSNHHEEFESRLRRVFTFENYICFGMFIGDQLIGVSSGWTTVRLYSDKQLEIDNVIINGNIQSKGYGKKLISEIQFWVTKNGYKTVELHTYLQNDRSHKFYFNQGYKILGFHFQRKL